MQSAKRLDMTDHAFEDEEVDGVDDERPAKRGITRDYTPFLLILQGMSLQLQGIALPPF